MPQEDSEEEEVEEGEEEEEEGDLDPSERSLLVESERQLLATERRTDTIERAALSRLLSHMKTVMHQASARWPAGALEAVVSSSGFRSVRTPDVNRRPRSRPDGCRRPPCEAGRHAPTC